MKNRAYSMLNVKQVSEDKRTISGIATTPEPDRVGDIVEPLGAEFKNPAPLLWMHDHRLPVGTVKFGKPTADGIPFEATIPRVEEPAGLKARLDEAWESVKSRLVAAVSIGFRPKEWSVIEATGGLRFTNVEIVELSLVTVPANADATITTVKSLVQKGVPDHGFENPDAEALKTKAGTAAKPVKTAQTKDQKMTLAEQIKAFRAQMVVKATRMEAIMEASSESTLDAAGQEEFDTLESEHKALADQIVRLESMERIKAQSATSVVDKGNAAGGDAAAVASRSPSNVQVKAGEKLEKGILFTRYAMALAATKGDVREASRIAGIQFGEDSAVTKTLKTQLELGGKFGSALEAKANVPAGSTLTGGSATWGSQLVDYENFAGDFIDFLRPQTILGKFGTGGIPSLRRVPFNVRIAGQTSGGQAYWVGEGAPKPLTKMDFNDVELRWAKIATIAVITEELIRFSNPSAERLVRDELAKSVIERSDIDFIDPAKTAVAGISPASITNGIAPIPSSS